MNCLTAARCVLEDCQIAFDKLERCEATSGNEWRVYWVATVTLLRAVGHVLDKVDGKGDVRTRTAISKWWDNINSDRSKHPIFWDFIDNERINIVKEYSFGVDHYEGNLLVGGEAVFDGDFLTVQDGIFAGEDGRDLAYQALEWWKEQFRLIDAAII